MEHPGRYSVTKISDSVYSAYLEALADFADWLLDRGYDVRILIGDLGDRPTTQRFKSLVRSRAVAYEEERLIDEPVNTVEDLMLQLAATDYVVATRFHNVLLSLLLTKPVIAISFHHKCSSLMSQMGLADYCHDMNGLNVRLLTDTFRTLESQAENVKMLINDKAAECGRALDQQYEVICSFLRSAEWGPAIVAPKESRTS